MAEVFFLSCGHLEAPAWAMAPAGQRRGRCKLSVTVAVMLRKGGDLVLVDAGFARATCQAPLRSVGLYATILGMRAQPAASIVDQLAALGLPASSVRTIIATHLHLDHIGGAVDFPTAEIVCSEREWQHARRWPSHVGYRKRDLEADRIVALALREERHLGFPRSRDLFGDGECVLLDARGHTPGHLAVALRGKGSGPSREPRTFVHTGDAADQRWEYRSGRGPSIQGRALAWKVSELRRTYESLRTCEAHETRPTLVPAHDFEVFAELPHAPGKAPKP